MSVSILSRWPIDQTNRKKDNPMSLRISFPHLIPPKTFCYQEYLSFNGLYYLLAFLCLELYSRGGRGQGLSRPSPAWLQSQAQVQAWPQGWAWAKPQGLGLGPVGANVIPEGCLCSVRRGEYIWSHGVLVVVNRHDTGSCNVVHKRWSRFGSVRFQFDVGSTHKKYARVIT